MKIDMIRKLPWFTLILFAAARVSPAATNTVELPGMRPDGSMLLPNQWSLRPAGTQVPMGDFPINIAVHPEGRYAAVLHSGHGPHEIIVVDLRTKEVVSRTKVNEAFYGLEFSPVGGRLFCSGAGDEVVRMFDFKNGQLKPDPDIPLRDAKERGIPGGMAVTADGQYMYVANVWGQTVSKIDLLDHKKILELNPLPDSTNAASAKFAPMTADADLHAITKRAEAQSDPASPDAPFPYACRVDQKRQRLYVSLWARASVAVIDLSSNQVVALWPTQEHPNEMILGKSGRHLFVANANRNTVSVFDTDTGKCVETLFASFSPDALPGSTPMSLALSPDEKTLYVANACNNNVAVFDVSTPGKSHSIGFIPVGWYPTSVRVTPDGRQLLVANGKGLHSSANPLGPVPGEKSKRKVQYIGELFPGTLGIIDLANGESLKRELADYTRQAYLCTPRETMPRPDPAPDNPIPTKTGVSSPIKYCIYIIKENRTYDQILGDMKEGNGDPKLCLFPENVTPNEHKISREFVLLDNFYVDAEVSADGHEWSMGANASDFVEKMWPLSYGHNKSGKFPYPSEGGFPIATPGGGYIWDRAREAGVSYRSYGEFTHNGKTPKDPATTRTAALRDHFDPQYRSFDTSYLDVKRADRFISELKRFETEGGMPRFQIVRLGNDHTSGTTPGRPTPRAQVADNDRAVGMVVEAVSHSKFWPQAAIFILEDDAQNGPDHVDAHRSPAYVVSPYTRHGVVDSTMYSTTSMLGTMERILGLRPMTQFDAAATPMFNSFQAKPNLRPYDALPANIDLTEHNTLLSWGAGASQKMDFSKEDATDEQLLNEIIWHSVRGPETAMPAPTHAAFVMAQPKKDDD